MEHNSTTWNMQWVKSSFLGFGLSCEIAVSTKEEECYAWSYQGRVLCPVWKKCTCRHSALSLVSYSSVCCHGLHCTALKGRAQSHHWHLTWGDQLEGSSEIYSLQSSLAVKRFPSSSTTSKSWFRTAATDSTSYSSQPRITKTLSPGCVGRWAQHLSKVHLLQGSEKACAQKRSQHCNSPHLNYTDWLHPECKLGEGLGSCSAFSWTPNSTGRRVVLLGRTGAAVQPSRVLPFLAKTAGARGSPAPGDSQHISQPFFIKAKSTQV